MTRILDSTDIPADSDRGKKLFSPMQVAGATLLGGPFGGCWLLFRNYRRLKSPLAAWITLLAGIIGELGFFTLLYVDAESRNGWVPFFLSVAMRYLAQSLQGDAYKHHLSTGGLRASNGETTGVGIGSLAFLIGMWKIMSTHPSSIDRIEIALGGFLVGLSNHRFSVPILHFLRVFAAVFGFSGLLASLAIVFCFMPFTTVGLALGGLFYALNAPYALFILLGLPLIGRVIDFTKYRNQLLHRLISSRYYAKWYSNLRGF